MEELEIVIDPDGSTRIHVKGSQGARCLDATRMIEEALGEVTDRILCPEFYEESEKIVLQGKTKGAIEK
jgi:hypothetical protein